MKRFIRYTSKRNPPGSRYSLGGSLCLLALVMPVKPLADIVRNYARCDRHQKCNEEIHSVHPPSVARLGKVQGSIYSIKNFALFCNLFSPLAKIRKIPTLPIDNPTPLCYNTEK